MSENMLGGVGPERGVDDFLMRVKYGRGMMKRETFEARQMEEMGTLGFTQRLSAFPPHCRF